MGKVYHSNESVSINESLCAAEKQEAIGKRLKELRDRKNMSSTQVAKVMGLKYRTIRNYETGVRDVPAMVLIDYCKHFNVSLDYIIHGTEITDLELCQMVSRLSAKQKRAVLGVIESY